MKEFITVQGFKICYNENEILAESESKEGAFIKLDFNDPETILHSKGAAMTEIDAVIDAIHENHDLLKAALKGEWVSLPNE